MIKKIKNSLTIKICILILVLLIAASGITFVGITRFLPTYYSHQLQEDIDSVSQEMIETIRSYETLEEASYALELFEAGSKVSVTILDDQGNPVWPIVEMTTEEAVSGDAAAERGYTIDAMFASENSEEKTVLAQDNVVQEENSIITQEDTVIEEAIFTDDIYGKEESNSAVKRYSVTIGGNEYTMIISGGMQPVKQALEILYQIMPYILGIMLVISILFAVGASVYLTVPVMELSRISQKMAELDFDSRYQGKRTDEIGILGKSLNELSGNLSKTLEELKDANAKLKSDIAVEREIEKKRIAFFSAVSHELKTPITILKGHLSGMLQGVGEYRNRDYYLQRSQETAEKMEDMVKELLTVSRIENRHFETQRTDLAEQLRLQLADLAELIENKKLDLQVDIADHLYADANQVMMDKVFSNLIMNAIRYTPEGNGNQIRVSLKQGTDGEKINCQIENTGAFVPEEALQHVFEAFYRVEQSRNRQTGGSGLGLYIVKMILEQHRADYHMENTREGVMFFFSF